MRAALIAGLIALLLSVSAAAVIETYQFDTPEQEARYHQLAAELRCPKCQNQNIADSNAPIAQDLREQLHRQLQRGASDDEIKDFMVARYGEFVLYRPRFGGDTLLLWLAPAVLLLLALIVLWRVVISQRNADNRADSGLSEEEQARLDALVAEEERSA